MLIDAIDHVQLAMPTGGEPLARWFYSETLGIPEVPKPPHLAVRGGCWFERGALRVHLGVQDDFVPATKAHPAFAVDDLDRLERQLVSAGVMVDRVDDPFGAQVYVWDPFGNRIEFREPAGTEPLPDPVDAVVDAAATAAGEAVGALIRFALEADRLKSVERQSFAAGGLRRENSAEHSWHVALMALAAADLAGPDVDVSRVVQMLLVHDVVEVDAGDTPVYHSAFDADRAADKAARERDAADRIFGILGAGPQGRLRALWDEYEAGATAEARFAHVFDRIAPMLLNLAAGGLTWRRLGVTAADVRKVMVTAAESPEIYTAVQALIDHAVGTGMLPSGESGLLLPGSGDFDAG